MTSPFDASQIRALLPPRLGRLAPLPPPLQAYLRYYGLDTLASTAQYGAASVKVKDATLVLQQFRQRRAARGTVVLIHGYMDHAALLRPLLEYLFRLGWDLLIYDLPGHGLSAGPRYEVESFFHYADQLGALLREQLPTAAMPLALIGHSTGAAISTTLLLREPLFCGQTLARTVLLAPLVRPCHWRSIRRKYRLLRPVLRRVRRVYRENSHDRRFMDFVRHCDPLQQRHIPLRWVGAMLAWERWLEQQPAQSYGPLIIQGSGDDTVHWQHNLQRLRDLFPHGEQRLIEGARHQLVNESPRWQQPVFALIAAALQETRPDTKTPDGMAPAGRAAGSG